MATLGSGINANNGLVSCNRQDLQDLQNKAINIDLIANTNYDLDGTIMKFYAPFNLAPVAQDKADVTNTCSHNITCVNDNDFDVALDKWQNEFYAFAKCATTMLTPTRIANALASYVKGWLNNEVSGFYETLETAYPAYAGDTTGLNIKEIIEKMILQLELNGYDRADMVVSLNTSTASDYRLMYTDCCELATQEFSPTTNTFGVMSVVNGKNFQTADIIVYVKGYAFFGNYCVMLPEVWDGTDQYKGRSIIGGEEGYGYGVYDSANSGVQYTAVAV